MLKLTVELSPTKLAGPAGWGVRGVGTCSCMSLNNWSSFELKSRNKCLLSVPSLLGGEAKRLSLGKDPPSSEVIKEE
jgi:hypothetical protein